MSYCMWCSAWVCRLWLAVVLWSCVVSSVHCVEVTVRIVTSTQCTQLKTQLHKTTANTPRQNTTCNRTRSYSPDDGHNDARNMLRKRFNNKYRISCILLVLSLHIKFSKWSLSFRLSHSRSVCMLSTCPANLMFLGLITVTIIGEEISDPIYAVSSNIQMFFSTLGLHIFLSSLCLYSFSL